MKPAPSPTPSALAQNFLEQCRCERRLSALTIKSYARDLTPLLALSQKTPLPALTTEHLRRCVGQLHGAGLSGRSLARMLSAWRGFFRYLQSQRILENDPCRGIRAPKTPKTLPHALSPDRAQRLMQPLGAGFLAVRDHALLELFYSSGLRLAELAGLKLKDLDPTQGTVRVLGKGAKVRIVPVGRKAWEALALWQKARLRAAQQHLCEQLFITAQGKPLRPRSIETRVALRARQLGLEDGVHPHVLRHTFASHVLQSSGDLRAVQEMMGHASIVSTQVYTHLDFQHLAQVYDAAHPRARRKS